ncbi:MAG: CRTAC1 family protein [Verrucomicrobiales bacterium]|nr:CRTAC1 family protein [Verrucomicrobiales bacterium]
MKTPAQTHRWVGSPDLEHDPRSSLTPPVACGGPGDRLRGWRALGGLLGVILLPLASWGEVTFTPITEGPLVTESGTSGFGSWGDFDNDGYPDLGVRREIPGTGWHDTYAIYRNNGDGTFSRLPDPPGLAGASYQGVGWFDWDNDGNQDVWATSGGAEYLAFGDGHGDFTLGSASALIGSWGAHADYDRDGLLDVYWSYRSVGNCLIHNQGNREFTVYRGQSAGPASLYTYGGSCAGDFDDDGWPDLYVPCLRDSRSYLFRNDGNGGFVAMNNLITQTTGPAFQAAWGDYDNDGRLDLFVARWNGTSALYRNLGNGEFERPANAPILTGTHNFVSWVDYDNDGFLDLWVSGYRSGNKLLRNNGDGTFTHITDAPIVTERPLNNAGTYQVAWFDYDNDGFLDAYVMHGDDNSSIWTVNQLFRNNGNDNAWLTVRPVGTVSNRDGAGAKVRALATYAGQARWQRRDITVGCLSEGNHRYAHFGLGDASKVDTLRLEWPSGIVQEFRDVPARQILTVTEPAQLVPLGPREFQIRCWKGMQFQVQKSHNLQDWLSLGFVVNQTGTLLFQDTQTEPQAARCYYRVMSAENGK